MKNSLKMILIIFATTIFVSCEKWTDIESKYEPDRLDVGVTKDEAYYKNLRMFKATMFDRKLSWGWFGGWTGTGSYMLSSLSGLPDSLDLVGIWGEWRIITDERAKDLEYVQKVKGTKVVITELVGNFGWLGFAPEGTETEEQALAYFGWEGEVDPHNSKSGTYRMYNDPVTAAQEAAIRKYARAVVEAITENGFDGYDMDWEANWTRGSLASYSERMFVYIDEMSKYFGPKSGTERLLIVDGYIDRLPKKLCPYFNLFIIQAYRANSFAVLNGAYSGDNRFGSVVRNFIDFLSVDEIAKKTVVTEEYEQGQSATGGVKFILPWGEETNSLKGMAMWNPEYENVKYERSGGCGVYHIEYGYAVTGRIPGFYPWIREAIQVMNPAANQ
jgi:hypothetical protein